MKDSYDVFISYHGGNGDQSKSSYDKAYELSTFLGERGIECFLYKKEKEVDFYDAINHGLRTSKHFILVACEPSMLSEWVRSELRQFDGLKKMGKKPNGLISAYIYGNIKESDLYDFNTVFTTKDIVKGDDGFLRLYDLIAETSNTKKIVVFEENNINTEQFIQNSKDLSLKFLSGGLEKYQSFTDEDYTKHCVLLTERLKCMVMEPIAEDCKNIVDNIYRKLILNLSEEHLVNNLLKVLGLPGTQKSYVLQMLYLYFIKNYNEHNIEPIYIHCDNIRNDIYKNNVNAIVYLNNLFNGLSIPQNRRPLFIIDGILNIIADDLRLDYSIRELINQKYSNPIYMVGIMDIFNDNPIRKNKSAFITSKYELEINLSPISLYDRNKCLRYISTISCVDYLDPLEVYNILNSSGLLTIDQFVICKLFDNNDFNDINIKDVFENELLESVSGSYDSLNRGAEFIFNFAYGTSKLDYSNELNRKMLQMISKSVIYMNCLMAIHFCNLLEDYANNNDYTFFNLIWPKEITRFITKKINSQPSLENILVQLGEHYNNLTPSGRSALSFYLGRIRTSNYKNKAVQLLNKYYKETNDQIKLRIIDSQFNNIPYPREEYKQDLFLLRGLTVSLIYNNTNNNNSVLIDYIHFLIKNDLANSINRGFHLEYYGDKRYLPNQNMLDYEDNRNIGERTLRILCNSIEIQLNEKPNPSMLLELFTVASLLQVRIENDSREINFRLSDYIHRFLELLEPTLKKVKLMDDMILSYFKMVKDDFNLYLDKKMTQYAPANQVSMLYLNAKDIKRTGWVIQNINNPESIMEHMYSCWFIGLVFLPENCDMLEGYSKSKILNMLLIHDLAETILSDIPKYEKKNYPNYNRQENDTMLNMLLKGTYSTISSLNDFVEAWTSWYEQKDENSRIAKDIDTIQAIYQFLLYFKKYPKNFDVDRVVSWLREIYEVQTDIGNMIVDSLIKNNDEFTEILNEFEWLC